MAMLSARDGRLSMSTDSFDKVAETTVPKTRLIGEGGSNTHHHLTSTATNKQDPSSPRKNVDFKEDRSGARPAKFSRVDKVWDTKQAINGKTRWVVGLYTISFGKIRSNVSPHSH